jgi:hypothetical protein
LIVAAAAVVLVLSKGATPPTLTPEPTRRSRDDIVRALVDHRLVPAATLDDGTRIAGGGRDPAPRSRDEIVRDLVEGGLVPAATLDDGTRITSR